MIFGSDGRYTSKANVFVQDAEQILKGLRDSSKNNYGLELPEFVYLVHQTLSEVCNETVLDVLVEQQHKKYQQKFI